MSDSTPNTPSELFRQTGNACLVTITTATGQVRNVELGNAKQQTVREALKLSEILAQGYEIRVSGNPANLDTPLTNGQQIVLVQPCIVTVGRLPGNFQQIDLTNAKDKTVREALRLAEISSEGYEIRVSGTQSTLDTQLTNGQQVLLLQPVRGNGQACVVTVGRLPGNFRQIDLTGSPDQTVAAALRLAELSSNGYEIRVSGEPANLNTPLTNGQQVLLLQPVRGN